MKKLVPLLFFLLPGCPWEVHPLREDQCSTRPNCGQCASEAVCAWDIPAEACVGLSSLHDDSRAARTLEDCPGSVQ